MSKIPPQLRQSLSILPQTATALALRHYSDPRTLEDFLAGTQHFVQCFLEVGGALRKLLPYLRNILFKALFYLFAKELLEGSVTEPFGVFGRVVGDDVRHERPCQTLGALVRILGEEWIQWTTGAAVADRRRCVGGRNRTRWWRNSRRGRWRYIRRR